jgi:hypothetical protein
VRVTDDIIGVVGKPQLGRLERVELRTVWLIESRDFTPWPAREENIGLLGDTIGLELEVEATEKDVGPFRADILCKDITTGQWVLIENQLERTDHTHLGQLLTYSAGLEAATVVWMAATFTEEHRAALDWLNQSTKTGLNFFGLEIELWRIGESPVAPKFNLISKPNRWSKVFRASTEDGAGTLTTNQQLHLEFWTQFKEYLDEHHSSIKFGQPTSSYWKNVSLGRSHFVLSLQNGMRDGYSRVVLWIDGPQKQAFFDALHARKDEIEQQLGLGPLQWEPLLTNNSSHIILRRTAQPASKPTWPELNEWFAKAVEAFRRVFGPVIRDLQPLAVDSGLPEINGSSTMPPAGEDPPESEV